MDHHLLQRKFVDLIFRASSKWVNWDPSYKIEVGSYGTVEKDTGDLRIDGNIYKDPEIQEELDKVGARFKLADHKPQDGDTEKEFIVASSTFSKTDFSLGPQADLQGFAHATLRLQGEFKQGKRSALLVMYRPRLRYIPDEAILKFLLKIPQLKKKWLVTRVYVCPAYSMYLSSKTGGNVSLQLVAKLPADCSAPASGVTVGGVAGLEWKSCIRSDLFREACNEFGSSTFTPLYTMKRKKRLFRDSDLQHPNQESENIWLDASPPWDPLDGDGEEEEIVFG